MPVMDNPGPGSYRGRFAPSPTGPLHLGSLVAAVGSALEARSCGGTWALRMDDLDTARCSQAAADEILRTLEALGFVWDGGIVWQSRRTDAYRAAFDRLRAVGHVYPCTCTRKELADSALTRETAGVYPGTCRHGLPSGRTPRAWRVRVGDAVVAFDDAIQGDVRCELATAAGDFVVLRADGLFAYQLAVVVDDADIGVTHVVRGADLLDSTARQIHLQRLVGLPVPAYAHLPVAVDAQGEKLSKQTLAPPVDAAHPAAALVAALDFLGQSPPAPLAKANVKEVWDWARENWTLARVARVRTRPGGVVSAR